MSTTIKVLLALVFVLVGTPQRAEAECQVATDIECPNGGCCGRATPVCCPFVCCGSNGRCSADGFSCVPLDEDEPEEEDVPTLPECEMGQVVALNRCAPTAPGSGSGSATVDDACGCTTSCSSNADCATGCCNQGYCALACVCSGGATVTLTPSPEACQMAGATSVEPINAPPIGGFGGTGCGVSGGSPAALTGVGLALAMLLRRRRR